MMPDGFRQFQNKQQQERIRQLQGHCSDYYNMMMLLQGMVRHYYIESITMANEVVEESVNYTPSEELTRLWEETRGLLKGLDDLVYSPNATRIDKDE